MINRKAVIVSVLGAALAAGSAAQAAGAGKPIFESSKEALSEVFEALGDGNLGKAAAGLGGLWGEGKQERKSGFTKVQQKNNDGWGEDTGKPPRLPDLRPTPPQRQDPPRQEPPRQTPPPEIPRLPPSNINPNPGTIRPAVHFVKR